MQLITKREHPLVLMLISLLILAATAVFSLSRQAQLPPPEQAVSSARANSDKDSLCSNESAWDKTIDGSSSYIKTIFNCECWSATYYLQIVVPGNLSANRDVSLKIKLPHNCIVSGLYPSPTKSVKPDASGNLAVTISPDGLRAHNNHLRLVLLATMPSGSISRNTIPVPQIVESNFPIQNLGRQYLFARSWPDGWRYCELGSD